MSTDEQRNWIRRVLNVDVTHADAMDQQTGEAGMLMRSLPSKYEGEHEHVGWRATPVWAAEDTYKVTYRYSDQEREERTAEIGVDGAVKFLADVDTSANVFDYAVDPETGKMIVSRLASAKAVDHSSGETAYLQTLRQVNEMAEAGRLNGGDIQSQVFHHSSMLGGGDVANAGTVTFVEGKITKVTNNSGHYTPSFAHLLDYVETLLRQGAMLDQELVDINGNPAAEVNPRAHALHQKILGTMERVKSDRSNLAKIEAGMLGRAVSPDLEQQILAAAEKLEQAAIWCQKALRSLAKLGFSPRNAITGEVGVKIMMAGVTGADAKVVPEVAMSTQEFLTGTQAGTPQFSPGDSGTGTENSDPIDQSIYSPLTHEDDGPGRDPQTVYTPLTHEPAAVPARQVDSENSPYSLMEHDDPPADAGAMGQDSEFLYSDAPFDVVPPANEVNGSDNSAPQPVGTLKEQAAGGHNIRNSAGRDVLMAELHEVAEERGLRPEDSAPEQVFEGTAPEIDPEEIDATLEALNRDFPDLDDV